jgi:uncharacterized protein (DUF736 family)
MSVIGTFTPGKDGGWTGTIRTLSIQAKVRFVPNDNRDGNNAPAFHIIFGHARVGEAWEARSGGDSPRDYVRVRVDDPAFVAPLNAALFLSEDRQTAQLVWSRRRSEV